METNRFRFKFLDFFAPIWKRFEANVFLSSLHFNVYSFCCYSERPFLSLSLAFVNCAIEFGSFLFHTWQNWFQMIAFRLQQISAVWFMEQKQLRIALSVEEINLGSRGMKRLELMRRRNELSLRLRRVVLFNSNTFLTSSGLSCTGKEMIFHSERAKIRQQQ